MYQNIYTPQPMAQPMQPRSNTMEWINVNGLQGAKDVQVMRGQTAWMMDMNEPIFYVKEADNMGVCKIKAFRFEEINPEQPVPYATKEDLAMIYEEIKALKGVNHESIICEKPADSE